MPSGCGVVLADDLRIQAEIQIRIEPSLWTFRCGHALRFSRRRHVSGRRLAGREPVDHRQRLAAEQPPLAVVVDPDTGAIAAEAVHAVVHEGAFTLEDVIVRRMAVALNRDVGLSAAPAIADVLVEHAGWSQDRAEAQLDRYRDSMRRFMPRESRPERAA